MGSVSSLISGHSFHSKHCRASQYKLRKSSHLKKLNRYSDGLLRFGFSQDSSHKSSSKSSKNEDFFYIKVNQKSHGSHRADYTSLAGGELGSQAGTSGMDFGTPTPQKLLPFPSQLEVVSRGDGSPRSGGCPLDHAWPESGCRSHHGAVVVWEEAQRQRLVLRKREERGSGGVLRGPCHPLLSGIWLSSMVRIPSFPNTPFASQQFYPSASSRAFGP